MSKIVALNIKLEGIPDDFFGDQFFTSYELEIENLLDWSKLEFDSIADVDKLGLYCEGPKNTVDKFTELIRNNLQISKYVTSISETEVRGKVIDSRKDKQTLKERISNAFDKLEKL